MEKILFIINPAGNGGAGVRRWEKFSTLWSNPVEKEDVIFTERPGHAAELAANAEGYSTIVSVGGDGTVNEVMHGIMMNKLKPALGLIPAGTGNDVGRNVGIASVEDAVRALVEGNRRLYDIIKLSFGNEIRYSFLEGSFGFCASRRTKPWMKRMLGATVAYYIGVLMEIIIFSPPRFKVSWDDGEYEGRAAIALAANVERSSGGSMVIGPGATPTDGYITVTIVPFKSKYDCLVRKFPKTPTGEIINEPGVKFFQTRMLHLKSTPTCALDIDGDVYFIDSALLEIEREALRIVCPGTSET